MSVFASWARSNGNDDAQGENMAITKLERPKGKRGRPKKTQVTNGDKTGAISVVLDHPAKGEMVTGEHYSLRLGTVGHVDRVEVCLDDGSWEPCRRSAGYWWYDWSGYKGGWHRAVARAHTGNDQVELELRKFRVSLGTTRKPTHASK